MEIFSHFPFSSQLSVWFLFNDELDINPALYQWEWEIFCRHAFCFGLFGFIFTTFLQPFTVHANVKWPKCYQCNDCVFHISNSAIQWQHLQSVMWLCCHTMTASSVCNVILSFDISDHWPLGPLWPFQQWQAGWEEIKARTNIQSAPWGGAGWYQET